MHYLRPVDRLRVQRAAEHLCQLGPRAMAELLAEHVKRCPDLLDGLDDYCRLELATLQSFGGDRFPARCLLEVPAEWGKSS